MTIIAAADGSALGNPGPNGWAWYIDDANWAAGGSPHGTNNQGELQAVLELLRATAGTDEPLLIMCDSKYVIDSITKWMPGWKRRGWRKADGAPVLNRELMESLDDAMHGRDVRFEWVKGHAGHDLNEAADERANGAARAYQAKQEPRRGPGFTMATDAGAAVAASAAVAAGAHQPVPEPVEGPGTPTAHPSVPEPVEGPGTPTAHPSVPEPVEGPGTPTAHQPVPEPVEGPGTPMTLPLWAEASDLLDGLDDAADVAPVELHVTLSSAELSRLRSRAEAQGISLEDALRRLI
ncbi:ribonuclease HI [Microbacterium profundi]|uniref:RNase H family protein n=1 Tax=Microbacterium profundi TaxID=450380 RepID=UPI001F2AFB50|nr:RNase H family protein [Microbacterium profundi]MCE7480964.1 ribonuclease HI [Microbacterium profundi]